LRVIYDRSIKFKQYKIVKYLKLDDGTTKDKLSKSLFENYKQAFWLNLINFVTLFRLAEIALTKQSVIKELSSFGMW
jgi:hypothetical protein